MGKKNGADFGTVNGVLGLFLRFTMSKLSRFSHLDVGCPDRVSSSSLICSGDLYSGSSPKSMVAMSSISGFSAAVAGSSVRRIIFILIYLYVTTRKSPLRYSIGL